MSGLNASVAEVRPRLGWITFLAAAGWLATLGMGLATLYACLATDSIQTIGRLNGLTLTSDELLLARALIVALVAVTIGYASVGALLAGRVGAERIAALLLGGGALFSLAFVGYVIGPSLSIGEQGSTVFTALWVLGSVAIGPGYTTILPGLAIAFPDGRLPSRRWRWPVGIGVGVVGVATVLQLVRPGPIVVAPGSGTRNPFGIEALPSALVNVGDVAFVVGLVGMTALGIAAVIVRYRRGNAVERQQQRWFLAAVSLAGLPLALSPLLDPNGTQLPLAGAFGLMLIPIAVGIAVTRYHLYEIDHLINRTLVYVPLTALLAGLYAATVALLQRVFQSVTGDKSDAAIIISTLILASIFTPLRKWLEGIVERRFKPTARAIPADPASGSAISGPEWEARVAAVALRAVRAAEAPELDAHIAAIALQVMRAELDARAVLEPPAKSGV
jgi:hypothetical protein